MTKQDELYNKIKEIGWNKNIKKYAKTGEIGFTYKGIRFRAAFFNNTTLPNIDFYFNKDMASHNDTIETMNAKKRLLKEIDGLLRSFGVKGVKDRINRIKDTSTKLPKKTLKLESTSLNEVTQNTVLWRVQKVLGKKNISNVKKPNLRKYETQSPHISFIYKGDKYRVVGSEYSKNIYVAIEDSPLITSNKAKELEERLNGTNINDVKKMTKKIKEKATVLPKKKIESFIEHVSKQ